MACFTIEKQEIGFLLYRGEDEDAEFFESKIPLLRKLKTLLEEPIGMDDSVQGLGEKGCC